MRFSCPKEYFGQAAGSIYAGCINSHVDSYADDIYTKALLSRFHVDINITAFF